MQVKYNGLTIESPSTEVATNSSNRRFSLFGGGYYSATNYTFSPALTGGKRDMYFEFGWPQVLEFKDYFAASRRTIGGACISKVPKKCWSTPPIIKDGDKTDTQFCKEVKHMVDKLGLWNAMKNLHIRSRVYQYGGIVIALKETNAVSPENPITSPSGGVYGLTRLAAKYQDQISSYNVEKDNIEQDFNSERYGLPKYFRYRENVLSDNDKSGGTQFNIHPDRVFTFSETASNGELYGEPALEQGFNALLGIEKIMGANPEAMFKNAQMMPWVTFNEKDNAAQILSNPKIKEAFDEAQERATAGLDPIRMLVGADVKNLDTNVASPKDIWTVLTQYLASTVDLPATELFGHTVGERATSNDGSKVAMTATEVRENVLTPKMIIPFFDKLIKLKILTPPNDYICVEWDDLTDPSESEKLENMERKYKMNKIAYETGTDLPFPDVNENRKAASYEEIEIAERFAE